MATTYERYLKLNIDGSRVGLERGESESSYFCTPKDAKVIGWAGVDGIHYCFVRGFGEMVFAVSPMNTPGNYVHPVARDFIGFLRLLLACGDAAALEQAYCWDQAQFDGFQQDNPLTVEQQAVLDVIRKKLLLTPMEQPFTYIKELQAEFNYSRIKYTEDYYEWVPAEPKIPEWKVYFDGSFWGHHGRERAGKEILLDRQFVREDEVWHIPAIYTCGKGLVVDLCVQVPAERIRAFMDKWNLPNDSANFTDELQMQIDTENPLAVKINPKVVLNGTVLSSSHGCGVSWNPCVPEGNGLEGKSVIQHYGLDPAYGWAIWRAAFPWMKKRKPQITTLSIALAQGPVAMPGPHFHVSTPGEHIEFTHPTTGAQHSLTVQEYERQEMSREDFGSQDEESELPTHYTVMSYTLSPDLPDGSFTVTDCARSDQPRRKRINPNELQTFSSVCAVGIIGCADGSTAIVFGGNGQGKLHAACSALHFESVDDVEWRMVFHEKRRKDVTVELM